MSMINPSMDELLSKTKPAKNRYALAIAAGKEARMLANKKAVIEHEEGMKPLSIAAHSIAQGKVEIVNENYKEETIEEIKDNKGK